MSNIKNICLFIIIILLTACASQKFTIGVVGDQFGSYDTDRSYEIMDIAVDKINKHDPDVIIHVGDIVESVRGINTFDDYKSNFKKATDIMNNSNTPWLVAIGDHGVVPPTYKANSSDRSREEWFMQCSNIFDTPILDSHYYSMNVDGYHLIALYSLENLHTDPRWGSIFLNKISVEQLSWLKKDLEKHKSSFGIIVIVHHPMWYVWSNWMEVHNILKEYNVTAVIAGHYHYDQDDGFIDNIRYLVMGSTGGVVKNTDANTGGVQEYGILEVNYDNIVDLKLYEVFSDSLLEWTPRVSTDRIQAISCMLDNLWDAVDLTIEDGKLSEHISISSISNPIDIPIEIEVSNADSLLTNQKWIINNETITNSKSMTLDPGYNVGWANYTSVGQWYKFPVIWEAMIDQDLNSFESITLTYKIKFEDSKPRTIRRDITYPVKSYD